MLLMYDLHGALAHVHFGCITGTHVFLPFGVLSCETYLAFVATKSRTIKLTVCGMLTTKCGADFDSNLQIVPSRSKKSNKSPFITYLRL